jgi:cell division septation protein DedD
VAAREVAKLKRLGHQAFVFTAPDGTPGPRFKVQVGPFKTRAEADRAIKTLRTQGYRPLIKR